MVLPFLGGASFVDHLCYFCLVLLCFRTRLFIDALWAAAGKGLTSWLLFVMSICVFVIFLCGILGQVWYLIVSIPDLCPLSYLHLFLRMPYRICTFDIFDVTSHVSYMSIIKMEDLDEITQILHLTSA